MANWKETKCGKCKIQRGRPVCNSCFSYDKFIPIAITNADRIRSMSDEELAEFLPIVSDFMCKPTDKCIENIFNRGECEKTKGCAMKWLQSEVEV